MHILFRVLIDFFLIRLIVGLKKWIRTCLPRSSTNEQSLLVWDSFCAHLTDSVKADLQRRRVNVAVIPGGLTPVLQPLDKCLNKPFKDNIRKQYLSWMLKGPFEFTPARKKKPPSRNLVFHWIKKAWCDIPEMVRRSFKVCGIANVLDSTEGDAVYEEMPEFTDEEDEKMDHEFDTDSEDDEQ